MPEILGGREEEWAGRTLQEEDRAQFLARLRSRLDSLDIALPKVEIRFNELTVEAREQWAGRRELPNLWNTTINCMQEMLMSCAEKLGNKRRTMKLLDDLSGIIKPSRMVLVLGRPGSGKTTLLRALAGKSEPGVTVKGSVAYNGLDVTWPVPEQASAYVSQYDCHQGELTVGETLDFAHRLFGGTMFSGILSEISRREQERGTAPDPVIDNLIRAAEANGRDVTTHCLIEMLGLSNCVHTIVGDHMRRGISGGQMKRLSIGEMLIGPARAFFMDEISNGLDSSTTYKIVNFLRGMAHFMDATVVVTLLQPSLETFELFDDIILIGQGKIMYQGPREKALEFFESMGFECPVQKHVPDFLLEVTSGMHQPQYWVGKNRHYKHVMCHEFAKSFKSYNKHWFHYDELHKSSCTVEPLALRSESSVVRKRDIFKISLSRELLLLKRNSGAYIFKSVQILLLAAIVTATFSRGKDEISIKDDLTRLTGAIYSGVVVLMFNGVVELTMMIMRMPVFYKQRDLQCYPGWAFLLPAALLHVPITLFESTMWVLVTYFSIGFAHSPARLFQLFLACCCIQESSVALNRFIAAIARTQVVANIIATAILVTVLVLGGFVVSKDHIHPWWIWGFWASPATYAQNAIAINEFLDERWSMPAIFGPTDEETLGKTFLKMRGMFTESYLFWVSIGALCGFCLFFNMLSAIALTYLNAPQKAHANFASTGDDVKVHAQHCTSPSLVMNGIPECQAMLPVQHLALVFKDIDYYVDMPSEMRKYGSGEERLQLLKNVSGAFRPGSLTALMGETGAGKTTLLDVLAGRKTGGVIEGKVIIAGHLKKQETFARVFGYCEQNDPHSPYITVYESLLFSASLRLPLEVSSETKKRFVDEVIKLVELKGLKGSLVGVPGAFGLSIDQRKRLTIAVELVANPSIIFMDEPTTGLDTPAASIVMKAIRKAADTGRTVVCTIHQPNIRTFETFDELLLMKRGGQLIYSGPLGSSAQDMVRYFEAIPGVPSMRNESNPAAWMLDVTSTDMEFELGIDFSGHYYHSSLHKESMQLIQELSKPSPCSEELKFTSKYAQSFMTQCIVCYLKQQWSYWRNSEQNLNRILITLIISLLFGTMFWNIGLKLQKEQDLFDILGVLYVSALFLGFVNCSSVQPIVWLERSVFYRERSSGMYSAMPYAIAQVAAEIPYIIVQVILFSFIVYSMVGFQWTLIKFSWFLSFIFLGFMYFTLLGMMLVSCMPSLELAGALSFFFFVLWNLFSGFFIPMPV
ncbi:unnamed protein product [Victoria cruziana]